MAKLFSPINTSDRSSNLTEESSSSLNNLPPELLLNVFSYLENRDLKKIRLTCKYFSGLARYPLMQKSKIHLHIPVINKISKIFAKDEVLPFHTVHVDKNFAVNPASLKILEKCFTKRLKCLNIWNSYLFDWLAEKPLPNLKEIFLYFPDKNKKIEFGKWHLGLYKELEDVKLNIHTPKLSNPLSLFQVILDGTLQLKRLFVCLDKDFDYLLEELDTIYNRSTVELLLVPQYEELYVTVSFHVVDDY